MNKIRLGLIGLGARGRGLLEGVIVDFDNIEITSVCDSYSDRAEKAANFVEEKRGVRPHQTTDYRETIDNDEVDAVVIMSAWDSHTEIAVYAMKAGKAVAMEVGGAYAIKDCWDLVDTYEQTKTPFMFLENCCFGRREMMALNMAEKGVLGDIVHCSGRYGHDLRNEITFGKENRHYRLRNYLNRNCENYPTHDLGPIAKVLKINQGNRLLSLTSTSSKSVGIAEYVREKKSDDKELLNKTFMQGDIVTTVLKTIHGETIVLTLDTTLPRYYSRGFTVRGTKGMYEEATDSVFLDRKEDFDREFVWRRECNGNASEYEKEYDHPVWKEYIEAGVQGSHDGMDFLEFKTFFDCLENNKPMPIDVYDAATWMAVTALSEESIARGSASVEFPDFTRGKWVTPYKY